MKITIKDIADRAGVSISTVSLVLNQKGYVADDTRTRIQKVMDELNYRPLRSARTLANHRTGNYGFILWEGHFSEVELFYSQVFLGMEYAAREDDYYILLTTVREEFDPKVDLPRFLRYRDVDGVVLAGRVPNGLIQAIEKENVPFVLVDYEVPGKNYNCVKIDNYNGAFRAVEQLVQSGREHIGFVGGTFFHPSIKERHRGYLEVLEKYGLPGGNGTSYSFCRNVETSRAIGEEGARTLFADNPELDAVFCCNDTTALGVINGLQKLGKRIPEDVAVLGFDDIPTAEFSVPRLSTVRVPKLDIGKEAYKLLKEVAQGPKKTAQTRTISVETVMRESCCTV